MKWLTALFAGFNDLVQLYFRDLRKVLEFDLIPSFKAVLQYEYVESEYFSEQFNSEWWAEQQRLLPDSGRLLALNLFIDETHAARHAEFGAYPVYITLGNIPMRMRCAINTFSGSS